MKKNYYLFLVLFLITNINSDDVLNETVYWELTRVDSKIEEKKFDEAEDILRYWYKKNWRSRSYNKAVIARTYGFFLFQRERFDEAIEKLQVAYDEKALPIVEATSLVQALAQLYSTQGNIQGAKELLLKFIEDANRQPKPVPGMHNIYALTALIYATENNYDLAIYNILEKYDLSLATMEVSYMKGLFDKPEEFTTLASFYLYKKNPAMSAKVLENAISEDQILFDTKNAKLLSDSWLFAKERIKSLDVIEESLSLNPNEEKLVNQYINIAFSAFEWNEVINGIRKAEQIGIEDDGKHDLMIGIAFFETKDLKNAENSFIKASNSKKYSDQGKAWLEYLNALKG